MAHALHSIDLDMRPVQVVAGAAFACALDDVGQVKCWGDNVMGSLGQGDLSVRGDQPDEMGRALPAVDLGDFAPIKLAAGDAHVCGLDAQGTVKCWGANDHQQLAVMGRDNHRGDDADEMGAQLPVVGLRANIVDIAAGPRHTCAVSELGAVDCWGEGYGFAPVGLNLRDHAAVTVNAGAQTCILDDAGTTVCWGLIDGIAQIDDPALPGTIHRVALPRPTVELATSAAMNCAVDVDGDLRCWGRNEVGQLGQGDVRDRTAADVMDLFPVSLDDQQL
jgi:alpha-tubulin suppressor-like RCC1 family protein